MGNRIVVALGGNALGKTPLEQLELVKKTAKHIVDMEMLGYKVIVTHGNGPQVGIINSSFEDSENTNKFEMPFAECGAMSQGYIGYQLQQAIQEELKRRNSKRSCVTMITQVLVDKNDPAFTNPTKPIGLFYNKKEADKISEETGYIFKEDAGRGFRRVVASPTPLKILELNIIKKLVDSRHIVIACGGGGIPVIKEKDKIIGIDAVIDKDMTSARLAKDLNADALIILTAVDYVYINYNKENQKKLKYLNYELAKQYIEECQFSKGSMLPKIKACLMFVKNNKNKAIITSLENASSSLKGKSGTIIKNR